MTGFMQELSSIGVKNFILEKKGTFEGNLEYPQELAQSWLDVIDKFKYIYPYILYLPLCEENFISSSSHVLWQKWGSYRPE